MTTIGEAIIEVHGDTSRLEDDVRRGTSSSKMGGIGRTAGKGLALGFTAAAGAVLGAGAFLKGAFDEAEEATKVGAITANAIRATGGAANVSAKQVENLSGAISDKAGIDDEAIQSGANLLLTFKNVRNEAGKGSAIFDRATKSAVDLSAAGFGSITGGSKMLGKALNDPIKGISALSKAGVTFTEDQKKQITAMTESGNVLGAQKIILGEVESQVGGAAAAQATAADKMGVAWGNLKETVGTALMPVFTRVMTFVTAQVIPALLRLGPTFTTIGSAIGPIASVIGGFISSLAGGGDGGVSGLGAKVSELRATFSSVFASISSTVTSVVQIVTVLWATFGSTLMNYARNTMTNVLMIIRGVFNIIAGIFKVISAVLRGDWGAAWDGIKQIVRGAIQVVAGIVRQLWNLISTIFRAGGIALRAVFSAAWNGIKAAAGAGMRAVGSAVSSGISTVIGFVRSLPGRIAGLAGTFLSAGKNLGGKIIGGIMDGLRNAGGFVSDLASSVKSAINGALNLPFTIKGPGPLPDFTIPAFARGTKSAPGGLALVGEEGPELVNLPRGSEVITAARTRAMAGSAGGGAGGRQGGALRLVAGTLAADPSVGIYLRDIVVEEIDDASEFNDTLGRMG